MRGFLVSLIVFSGCRCADPVFGADEAARICLTLQACSPQEFASTYGNSLEACTTRPSLVLPWPGTMESSPVFTTGLDKPFRDVYKCMLDARGDCAKASACWALDGAAAQCSAPTGIINGLCGNDDRLSGCNLDRQHFEVSCPRYGAVCTDLNFFGNFNVCALSKCPAARTCRGTQAEICSGSSMLLLDCARSGKRCEVSTDGGGATCVPGQTKCDPMGRRCDGTVSVVCDGLGFESRTDCAENPTRRRCKDGECVDTGTQCSAAIASCEGTKVQFCQDGFSRKVDCVGAGFAACDAGACVPN